MVWEMSHFPDDPRPGKNVRINLDPGVQIVGLRWTPDSSGFLLLHKSRGDALNKCTAYRLTKNGHKVALTTAGLQTKELDFQKV